VICIVFSSLASGKKFFNPRFILFPHSSRFKRFQAISLTSEIEANYQVNNGRKQQ
jgi:hypothetical protein